MTLVSSSSARLFVETRWLFPCILGQDICALESNESSVTSIRESVYSASRLPGHLLKTHTSIQGTLRLPWGQKGEKCSPQRGKERASV